MAKQIKDKISKCSICLQYETNATKEPLLSHEVPQRPWEKVGVDIFTFKDHDYLITVDYFSGYFEIDRLPTKRIGDVVYCLKQQFCRHGIPDIVFSDNSPFAAREFKVFAANYEFKHKTSSPRYPQSNGRVENAVKIVKRLMTKAIESRSDPFLALLDWRNTPSQQLDKSPVQLLYGRRTRTRLPIEQSLLGAFDTNTREKAIAAKMRQAHYYNRGAKERPQLAVGQTVRFKQHDNSDWFKGEIS